MLMDKENRKKNMQKEKAVEKDWYNKKFENDF